MTIKNCFDKYGNTLTLGDVVSIDLEYYGETFTVIEILTTGDNARVKLRKCIGATPFNINANRLFWVYTPRNRPDEE